MLIHTAILRHDYSDNRVSGAMMLILC